MKFAVGSAKISPGDEEQLKQLAQTAVGLSGYIVEVVGYADSTGSAAMNTALSEKRAKAAITYLMQQGNVPVRHIIAPGAMGEYCAVVPNETKAGQAENRRVEVKVLVNKGLRRRGARGHSSFCRRRVVWRSVVRTTVPSVPLGDACVLYSLLHGYLGIFEHTSLTKMLKISLLYSQPTTR